MTITRADQIAAVRAELRKVERFQREHPRRSDALPDPDFIDRSEAIWRAALATLEAQQWRKIDESTPRHGNYARVYVEEGLLYCPDGGEATHWMPLPPPPEEQR